LFLRIVRPGARRRATLGLCLVGLLAGGCGGAVDFGAVEFDPPDLTVNFSNDFEDGDLVAQFELAAPSVPTFVLRGTLPLPRGIYEDGSLASPFHVQGSTGASVPAQIEIVSRYANVEDGADVVEIIARVDRPLSAAPGDRVTYDVLWRPNAPASHVVETDVAVLLQQNRSLVLRTSDVFGHLYEADLLRDWRESNAAELVVHRDGPWARQVRTYENLEPVTPVGGGTGTLPHMMGVHAYLTTWADERFVSLDLRLHNGHDGHEAGTDADDSMGKLYFNELELVVPAGWTLFQAYEGPTFGTPFGEGATRVFPLIEPIGGGDLHVFPLQQLMNRRLVLCRDGAEPEARASLAQEGLGFCRDGDDGDDFRLLSWWNPVSARYFAQNLPLPTLDFWRSPSEMRTSLSSEFNGVETALLNGTVGPFPINTGNLGWAHPWGLPYGGFHGGTEIYFWDGVRTAWGASTEGYRRFQVMHRMYTERHRTALYDRHGVAYNLEDWILMGSGGPYLPTWMFLVPWLPLGDAHGFEDAPTFQVDAVANLDRKPDYEDDLLNFGYVDTEHLVRVTNAQKSLVWLGNDTLAKDDLRLQAELARATYSMLPQTENGQAISTGNLWDRRYVQDHPGGGYDTNRAEGWILDAVASWHALADGDWRDGTVYWFEDVLETMEIGQSGCTGALMSKPNLTLFGGQYRILQSISECILQNGLWGVRSSVYDGVSPSMTTRVDDVLVSSCNAMISALAWNSGSGAPYFGVAVGPYDLEQPGFCGATPPGGTEGQDGFQSWNVMAFGYLLSGNPSFLNRATTMAGGTLNESNILGDGARGTLENRIGMLSLHQQLSAVQ